MQKLFKVLNNMITLCTSRIVGELTELQDLVEHFGQAPLQHLSVMTSALQTPGLEEENSIPQLDIPQVQVRKHQGKLLVTGYVDVRDTQLSAVDGL